MGFICYSMAFPQCLLPTAWDVEILYCMLALYNRLKISTRLCYSEFGVSLIERLVSIGVDSPVLRVDVQLYIYILIGILAYSHKLFGEFDAFHTEKNNEKRNPSVVYK